MELRYISGDTIAATLAEGDALLGTAGPCEVSFPADPEHPYFEAALASGVTISPYQPAVVIPMEVDRHQALLALLAGGITRAMIEASIAAIVDPIERETTDIRYQQPRWRRDSDFIAWGAGVFGLSPADVDALFIAAGAV